MKIAILGPAYPFRGGIAAYNERLALQLLNEGHEVSIYTFTVQYPKILFPGKTQYSEEQKPKKLYIIRCLNSINPFNWVKVGNRMRNENFDLIIVRFWIPFMGPALGTVIRRIRKNKFSKIVAIVDNMIPHESRVGDRIFSKYFIKPVDGFLAMSDIVIRDINTFDNKKPKVLSPHPLYDIYGAVTSKEESRVRLKLDVDTKYILFFGVIRKYKGLDLLLEAFSDKRFKNENIKLIVAGEYYSEKEKYLKFIEQNGLENQIIQIDKFIPDSDVGYYFNACDLVVQPYRSATQSGVTQIAYHFNKPMVVTDVGGLKEMCPDGIAGYVVPTEAKAISNAIFKFFYETDVNKMIENVKEEKKKYSWEELTRNILNLYKDL